MYDWEIQCPPGFGSRSGSQVAALYAWATECHGEPFLKPLGHGDDFPDKNDKII